MSLPAEQYVDQFRNFISAVCYLEKVEEEKVAYVLSNIGGSCQRNPQAIRLV